MLPLELYLFFVFVFFQLVDFVLTVALVRRDPCYDVNGLANRLIHLLGVFPGMLLLKTSILAVTGYFWHLMPEWLQGIPVVIYMYIVGMKTYHWGSAELQDKS